MDQTAFRELLARRRDGPRPQKGAQGFDDDFGQHRRPAQATSSAEAPVAMRPRTVRQSAPDAGAYMDRAEARRRGLAADVPQEHKGLDLQLLAEQKAKMHSEAQRSESPREHPAPDVSDAEPANERKPGEPPTDTPPEPETTEQDLEAALDEGRHRPAESRDVPKFRPIQPAEKPAEPAPAAPAPAAPDVIYVNGKRMRRKKKAKTGAETQPSAAASGGAAPSARRVVEQEHNHSANEGTSAHPLAPPAAPSPPGKPLSETPAPSTGDHAQNAAGPAPSYAVDAAEDDDIFGEADEWQGIPADSDSDTEDASTSRPQGEDAGLAPPSPQQDADAPPEEPAFGRRDWFAPAGHSEVASPSPEPEPSPEHESSSSSSPPPQRLEGLSSSALPSDWSRWLLEREEKRSERNAQRQPAQRKRKRSKKGKGDIGSP